MKVTNADVPLNKNKQTSRNKKINYKAVSCITIAVLAYSTGVPRGQGGCPFPPQTCFYKIQPEVKKLKFVSGCPFTRVIYNLKLIVTMNNE